MSGRLLLMGSGETSPSMVGTHRLALEAAGADTVTILDTPFGFQENADQLTERIQSFFSTSLRVATEVATLRRADAPVVERERMLAAVARSSYVFAGPGSPSYALAIWRDVGLCDVLAEVVLGGGTVALASAAAVTAGRKALPVYEIYKVGQDPFWLEGLDLTGRLGVPATVVPHWNNAEGGNHDTSRCYLGERRLGLIEPQLEGGILGIDEHTALALDLGTGEATVSGVGSVTVRRRAGGADGGREETVFASGEVVTLDEVRRLLGADEAGASPPPASSRPARPVLPPGDEAVAAVLEAEEAAARDPEGRRRLRSLIVELGEAAVGDRRELIGGFVEALLELREAARAEHRYEEADRIRERLAELGVEVRDTVEGAEWLLLPDGPLGGRH